MRTELLLPVIWNEANLNDKYKLIAETDECSDVCGFENDPEFGVDVFFGIFGGRKRSLVDFHPASCGFSADLTERKRLLTSTSTGMSATTRSTKTNTTTK